MSCSFVHHHSVLCLLTAWHAPLQGFTTMLMTCSMEIHSFSYVWRSLKEQLGEEIDDQIRSMTFIKGRKVSHWNGLYFSVHLDKCMIWRLLVWCNNFVSLFVFASVGCLFWCPSRQSESLSGMRICICVCVCCREWEQNREMGEGAL